MKIIKYLLIWINIHINKYLIYNMQYLDKAGLQRVINYIKNKLIRTKVSELENDSNFVTTEQVDERFEQLVGAAPEALDTLEEIANKFQDNDDIHAALVSSIAEKASKTDVEALQNLTTNYKFNGIAQYSVINSCKKDGYYLIIEDNNYNILTVHYAGFDSLIQCYYRVKYGDTFSVIRRNFDGAAWSNWVNTTIDADKVDGYHASVNPAANTIPVADANGMLPVNSIYTNPFKAVCNTAGWYRVYNAVPYSNNSHSQNIILNIAREYNYNKPEAYTFAISITFDNNVSITQLSGARAGMDVISKIRVLTKNNSPALIEFYYDGPNNNVVHVNGLGFGEIFAPVLSNNIPEGYTATEFTTGTGFKASDISGLNCIKTRVLTPQNLDADELVEDNTIYTVNSDMNTWPSEYSFTNFPTENPGGGFTLFNIKEGNYKRQIYTHYGRNSSVYIRCTHVSGGIVVWSSWKAFAFTDSNAASADKLTTKQLTNENLNSLTPDNFSSYYAAYGNTCTNKPAAISNSVNDFSLTAVRTAIDAWAQVYIDGRSGDIYKRRYTSQAGWSSWKKLLTEDNIVTVTQAQYDALTTKDPNTLYCIHE